MKTVDYTVSFKISVTAEEGDERLAKEYFEAKLNEFVCSLAYSTKRDGSGPEVYPYALDVKEGL